jgi:hypothetical protein
MSLELGEAILVSDGDSGANERDRITFGLNELRVASAD